jgi:hypothetical protein
VEKEAYSRREEDGKGREISREMSEALETARTQIR